MKKGNWRVWSDGTMADYTGLDIEGDNVRYFDLFDIYLVYPQSKKRMWRLRDNYQTIDLSPDLAEAQKKAEQYYKQKARLEIEKWQKLLSFLNSEEGKP